MGVLIFQISLLLIILGSTFLGRKTRNWVILGLIIFTIIEVFMPWLMIVQIFTIIIGYSISESIFKSYNQEKIDNFIGNGCLVIIIIGIILFLFNLGKFIFSDTKHKNTEQEINAINKVDTANYMNNSSVVDSSQIKYSK